MEEVLQLNLKTRKKKVFFYYNTGYKEKSPQTRISIFSLWATWQLSEVKPTWTPSVFVQPFLLLKQMLSLTFILLIWVARNHAEGYLEITHSVV